MDCRFLRWTSAQAADLLGRPGPAECRNLSKSEDKQDGYWSILDFLHNCSCVSICCATAKAPTCGISDLESRSKFCKWKS